MATQEQLFIKLQEYNNSTMVLNCDFHVVAAHFSPSSGHGIPLDSALSILKKCRQWHEDPKGKVPPPSGRRSDTEDPKYKVQYVRSFLDIQIHFEHTILNSKN